MIQVQSVCLTAGPVEIAVLIAFITGLHPAFALQADGHPVAAFTALTAGTTVVEITAESIAFIDAPITVIVFTVTDLKARRLGGTGVLTAIALIIVEIEVTLIAADQNALTQKASALTVVKTADTAV